MPRWLGFIGPWGIPPDGPAWGAFALAVAALAVALVPPHQTRDLGRINTRAFVAGGGLLAAFLSLGYVAFYLRGGPRIIDSTMYFLQGRALEEGHFAWSVPDPTASFRGRFLLAHVDPHRGATVAGIFPPGYPLLLSLGFAVGAPMVVGPALAAAIVAATFALARELAREAGVDRATSESVARLAAVLSIVCAALRYHTADTMAHGACALAFAVAILAALHARGPSRPEASPWMFLVSGLALGFLVATRFASALALGAVLGWLAIGSRAPGRSLLACALGAIPGVALLLVAQLAATGDLFGSTQQAYYATSDGPPGCFRYGFGAGVGCLFEHGDFVRARLADGYGLRAALGTTARRLGHHFADVANFGPLAALIAAAAWRPAFRTRGVRACLAVPAALVAAYAPFYFDGDYPGAGARFFADALPVEHALVAMGVVRLARALAVDLRRAGAAVVAVALLGFAVHMSYAHESLRDRDGGQPMFDPAVLTRARLGDEGKARAPALVFIDTDHGFDLAHDPASIDREAIERRGGATSVPHEAPLYVARSRGDDYDRLLYERLGHPTSWVYRFQPAPAKTVGDLTLRATSHGDGVSSLDPWGPPPPIGHRGETWRFESENEWPPLAQAGDAWAEPLWASDTCASPPGAGRVLAIHAGAAGGDVTIALPIPRAGRWKVTPRLLDGGEEPRADLDLLATDGRVLARWDIPPGVAEAPASCTDLPARAIDVGAGDELRLRVRVAGRPGTARLDRVVLTSEAR